MRLNRLLYQTYSSTYTIKDYSLTKEAKSPSAFQKGIAIGEATADEISKQAITPLINTQDSEDLESNKQLKKSKSLGIQNDEINAKTAARNVPPRLLYIPRETQISSKGKSVDNDFKRDNANNTKRYKNPPIPCIFYPWFKDHSKLMIYFHGIGEDLHVIRKEIQFIRDMLMLNVLAIEYPGYGINWNDGICSEDRMRKDAR